jgi:histidine kinase
VQCNEATKNFIKKPFNHILGHDCCEVIHGEPGPVESCPFERMKVTLARETATIAIGDRWYYISVDPLLDTNGNLKGMVHIMTDVTARERTEEELKRSEHKFKNFFENQPAYCYMISLNGIIIDVNNSALQALGYTKEELKGKPLQTIYAPEVLPKMDELFERWKLTGSIKEEEMVIITKNGMRRTVLLNVNAVKGKDGKILNSISVQTDITDRKKAENELIQTKKLAAIGQLATAVAHEINNPLTNISFLTANISEMTDDTEILKKLKEISNQRKIATDIVQSLQNFSCKIEPKLGIVNLDDSISDSIKMLEGSKLENIVVAKKLIPNLPPIRADPEQVRQVFVNLIKNAFDAMPKGGSLTISAALKGNNSIEIQFEDNGSGISQEDLPHVFNPFFTSKGVNKGLGLGLTICKGIIEAHKGSIDVESKEGRGSTFIVTLPVG